MPFNPRDPYDAAALYNVWFSCGSCPARFDYVPRATPGLEYYHQLGQQARLQGWSVLPGGAGVGAAISFNVLCPDCSRRLGVSGCDAMLLTDTRVIEALCEELEAVSQKAG